MQISILIVFLLLLALVLLWVLIKSRNMEYWIGSYAKICLARSRRPEIKRKVYFCLADHYEPYWGKVDQDTARKRVEEWLDRYSQVASKHKDSAGKSPQHSFFYPAEEYDEVCLNMITELCQQGFGDVEIHLHHDDDTAENLAKDLNEFKHLLHDRHGLLRKDPISGEIIYGFIHGNWALDNARPDGRWCGVDNEIQALLDTGCVFDMTLPCAPDESQTSTINSIYFAAGKDGCTKSHDTGRRARVGGGWARPDEMLMIQGPLELNWKTRKLGVMPKIEAGEVSQDCPPTAERIDLWLQSNIVVQGAEEYVFVKVYTHGAQEEATAMFFNGGFELLWSQLEGKIRDADDSELYYVSAWQMYEKIKELVH